MIQVIPLSGGVTLRYCADSRFKKSAMSLQLLRPMCHEEAALNALLPSVLLRGTRRHQDIRAITEHLDELYGGSIGALVRRCGDVQTVGFYMSFLDDRFAMHGDRILAPMAEFLRQCLLEPKLVDGAFDPGFVESEKRNLIATIESELNDKRSYAAARLLRQMCRGDSYAVPRLGDAQRVAAITPQSLYRHYQTILRASRVEIFYIGSASCQEVAALMRPFAEALAAQPLEIPHHPFVPQAPEGTETEQMELQQSKLCMGFVTEVTYGHPLYAATAVLNSVYGSGMTSKLFTHVREKLSLCYYAGSAYYGSKGILTVSSGIDEKDYPRAREEILGQLEQCRLGCITAQELEAGKAAILSSLESTPDSPGAMEGYYGTAYITGFGRTLEQYAEAVSAVTAEQVAEAARLCRLHSVFLLKGTA